MQWSIKQQQISDFVATSDGPLFHAVLGEVCLGKSTGGKAENGVEVDYDPAFWDALFTLLFPGGFGIFFSPNRDWHRLAVSIEDAGFVIHPSIFGWVYSLSDPERVHTGKENGLSDIAAVSLPGTWQRYCRGRQAMSPLIVFQKPYDAEEVLCAYCSGSGIHRFRDSDLHMTNIDGVFPHCVVCGGKGRLANPRPVDVIAATGAGALNIDGARIAVDPAIDDMLRRVERGERLSENWRDGSGFKNENNALTGVRSEGRWPANFFFVHTRVCRHDIETNEWYCSPDCPSRRLGEQSGQLSSGDNNFIRASSRGYQGNVYGKESRSPGEPQIAYGDSGTASRFFYQATWTMEQFEQMKRSTPGCAMDELKQKRGEGKLSSLGCQTAKPISLSQWLSALLLPPDIYTPRRLLVPFTTSGNEIIGAMMAGWEEVVAIRTENKNIDALENRLRWWCDISQQLSATDIERIVCEAQADELRQFKQQAAANTLPLFRGN